MDTLIHTFQPAKLPSLKSSLNNSELISKEAVTLRAWVMETTQGTGPRTIATPAEEGAPGIGCLR